MHKSFLSGLLFMVSSPDTAKIGDFSVSDPYSSQGELNATLKFRQPPMPTCYDGHIVSNNNIKG